MAELQDDVYLSIGITWFAALVALCLRLIARRITRNKSWFDDYLSVLAFVSQFIPHHFGVGTYMEPPHSSLRQDIALF